MSEHILSAALTFALLAGGTAAVGSEMLGTGATRKATAPATQIVTLPQVMVVGSRATAPEVVTLPQVMITARRQAATEIVTLPKVQVTARRQAPNRLAQAQASDAPSSPGGARSHFLRAPGL